MHPLMYDRGRGPELRSCRITVYDLIPTLLSPDYSDDLMLELWPTVTREELAALKQYVADNHDEVMAKHRQIEERRRQQIEAQRNDPEFRAYVARVRANGALFREWVQERKDMGLPSPAELGDWGPTFREWVTARQAATPVS